MADAEDLKKSIFKRQQEKKSLLHKYSSVESEEVNKVGFRKISPVVSWGVVLKLLIKCSILWRYFGISL